MVHNAFPDDRKNELLSERIESNRINYIYGKHMNIYHSVRNKIEHQTQERNSMLFLYKTTVLCVSFKSSLEFSKQKRKRILI